MNRDTLPHESKIIRDAMLAHCEYRDGRFYATEAGCEAVRKIFAEQNIPANVCIGDDGRFLVTIKVTAADLLS